LQPAQMGERIRAVKVVAAAAIVASAIARTRRLEPRPVSAIGLACGIEAQPRLRSFELYEVA
jgi:hypothetical protein